MQIAHAHARAGARKEAKQAMQAEQAEQPQQAEQANTSTSTRTLARADPALHAKKESNQRKRVRTGQVSLASKPGNMQSNQRQ